MATKKERSQRVIRGDDVNVLCVRKRDAKSAKRALEGIRALHKRYRMVPSANFCDCIALPIILPTRRCDNSEQEQNENDSYSLITDDDDASNNDHREDEEDGPGDMGFITRAVEEWKTKYEWDWIQHIDRQVCPYSTAVMGNHHHHHHRTHCSSECSNHHPTSNRHCSNQDEPEGSSVDGEQNGLTISYGAWMDGLTSGQQALYRVLRNLAQQKKEKPMSKRQDMENSLTLTKHIQSLDSTVCPKKLEVFGDDRTLVLQPNAFPISAIDQLLECHILNPVRRCGDENPEDTESECHAEPSRYERIRQDFWAQLAAVHKTQRIARRGRVDPNSKIRESGHRLVWPSRGIPETTGPGAPGWIQVTEQGIRQSFDMCRVMFSRGNISEKIRFGKLVQPGEHVLDLYAGIGYYTLPALIVGKAARVVACEWNEHAVRALRFNILDNKISSDRVTVLQGDCRVSAQKYDLVNRFDRVSLGLLPSAEGGWRTAIKALGPDGGWLHIHANVPVTEVNDWSFWMSREIWSLVREERSDKVHAGRDGEEEEEEIIRRWIVLCHHVEKVKSFAPTVAHYVADVYVGCAAGLESIESWQKSDDSSSATAVVLQRGVIVHCPEIVKPPSCALSPDGALSQAWMR